MKGYFPSAQARCAGVILRRRETQAWFCLQGVTRHIYLRQSLLRYRIFLRFMGRLGLGGSWVAVGLKAAGRHWTPQDAAGRPQDGRKTPQDALDGHRTSFELTVMGEAAGGGKGQGLPSFPFPLPSLHRHSLPLSPPFPCLSSPPLRSRPLRTFPSIALQMTPDTT